MNDLDSLLERALAAQAKRDSRATNRDAAVRAARSKDRAAAKPQPESPAARKMREQINARRDAARIEMRRNKMRDLSDAAVDRYLTAQRESLKLKTAVYGANVSATENKLGSKGQSRD